MHILGVMRERFPFLGLVAPFDDASLETEPLLAWRKASKLAAQMSLLVGNFFEW